MTEKKEFLLEQNLKDVLVGQEEAISIISKIIRRKETGWWDENENPLILLFLGDSGTGKTEMAKQIGKYFQDSDPSRDFIHLDMAKFSDKHALSRLIGGHPDYLGLTKSGELTEPLSKSPKATVLIRRVEKAHPDVINVLVQLFDDGTIVDGEATKIDAKDAIFLMISDLAGDEITQRVIEIREKEKSPDEAPEEIISQQFIDDVVMTLLKSALPQERFLERIKEIVYFLPFTKPEVIELVKKQLHFWAEKGQEKYNIELKWGRRVVEKLSEGYKVALGANSIKREVEDQVINQLAEICEKEDAIPNAKIRLLLENEEIVLKVELEGETFDDDSVQSFPHVSILDY